MQRYEETKQEKIRKVPSNKSTPKRSPDSSPNRSPDRLRDVKQDLGSEAQKVLQKYSYSSESWVIPKKDPEDIIVIPSMSFDQKKLEAMQALSFYEESLLCTLCYLRNPNVRLVYVTSMPIDQNIMDYYMNVIQSTSMVSVRQALSRLDMISVNDPTQAPLSKKILVRPRVINKIKSLISPEIAHITCYTSSNLEFKLAEMLQVSIFANDPELVYWSTASGSCQVFQEAEVKFPFCSDTAFTLDDLIEQVSNIYQQCPHEIEQFIVKIDSMDQYELEIYIQTRQFEKDSLKDSILQTLKSKLLHRHDSLSWENFCEKIENFGAVAQEWIPHIIASPSCQAMILPTLDIEILSTHDHILNHKTRYTALQFPASSEYRHLIIQNTIKIGRILAEKGCQERIEIEFVIVKQDEQYEAIATDIHFGWRSASSPFIFGRNLTEATLTEDGLLLGCDDLHKFYMATDQICHASYQQLDIEDFIQFINQSQELQFDSENLTGVVLNMLSGLEFGKFGMIAVGNSPEEAEEVYDKALTVLEKQFGSQQI